MSHYYLYCSLKGEKVKTCPVWAILALVLAAQCPKASLDSEFRAVLHDDSIFRTEPNREPLNMLLKPYHFTIFATCIISVTTLYYDYDAVGQPPDSAVKDVGKFKPRIVGGYIPYVHSLPFVVYIQIFGKNGDFGVCTGSIIASRYVMTAFHCLADAILPFRTTLEELRKRMIVNVGSMYKKDGRPYKVVDFYPFRTKAGKYEDFVILKLDRELYFSKGTIKPAVLGRWIPKRGEVLTIAGHGRRIANGRDERPDRYILANVKVEKNITLRRGREGFCARGVNQGPAKGDSGGPALKIVNRQYVQVGMIAGGKKILVNSRYKCDEGEFILIAPYCDFIYEKTEGTARCQQVNN
uniref:Peptidase S1 domain-containing protein n=1 Tax=Panagrellus redivivus TaxID=6233 RepID=A0A7E4USY8_PANRE